jgi:energy-coupling factor transport system permease protein
MRSPFAYIPRPAPLQTASPGAAVTYLGALIAVAFLYSNPIVLLAAGCAVVCAGLLAGARAAVRAALWMGLTLAFLIVAVNALVVSRGLTVWARLGEWPLLGQVDVTAEAVVAGAVLGLRAAVVMVAFGVYSACVDPDRVLRALRPIAGRSALTATLVSRLVPVAAADAARLRDAAQLRGPAAAPVGRGAMARRLLAGSLDRAVDVAATLELRGYSLEPPRGRRTRPVPRSPHGAVTLFQRAPWKKRYGPGGGGSGSRYDRRFYATGAFVLAVAIAGKLLGADAFAEYPATEIGVSAPTLGVAALVALSGLAPLSRRPAIFGSTAPRTASNSLPVGPRI